jgi:hypothetical protein
MANDHLPTGLPALNELLEKTGGLKRGDFTNTRHAPSLRIADIGLLKEGTDSLTQSKTILRRQQLVAKREGLNDDVRTVWVVYSEAAGMEKGLFFVTHALADVHFANITGENKAHCNEQSGGRTIQEMLQHLFYS